MYIHCCDIAIYMYVHLDKELRDARVYSFQRVLHKFFYCPVIAIADIIYIHTFGFIAIIIIMIIF